VDSASAAWAERRSKSQAVRGLENVSIPGAGKTGLGEGELRGIGGMRLGQGRTGEEKAGTGD
jgi:hypothetical protein